MSWKDGHLLKAVIKSTIEGNLRLRSYDKLILQGKKLDRMEEGVPNENLLFVLQQMARSMASEKTPLKGVQIHNTHLYDYQTQIGEILAIMGKY